MPANNPSKEQVVDLLFGRRAFGNDIQALTLHPVRVSRLDQHATAYLLVLDET